MTVAPVLHALIRRAARAAIPPLHRFLEEQVEVTGAEADRIAAGELVAAYLRWRALRGLPEISERAASNELREAAGPRAGYRDGAGRSIGFTRSSKVFYTGLRPAVWGAVSAPASPAGLQ